MDEIRKVEFCPHCGNRAPQKLVYSQHCRDVGWAVGGGEEYDLAVDYFIAVCETCNHILVYQGMEDYADEEHFTHADLVYPRSGQLDKSVPAAIHNIYEEAFRIKEVAPNAFAVQIRKGLEALCEDRGEKDGTLQKRLNSLASKGEIPSVLAEVSDILRLLGNAGAHAKEHSVHPSQVHAVDEFFRTVIEYVYVAPNRLKDFRASLDAFRSKVADEKE
jgi:hypothetical protein